MFLIREKNYLLLYILLCNVWDIFSFYIVDKVDISITILNFKR